MKTSHVGSFPLEFAMENVRRIAVDLREIGLDVPPYPQLRNFVDIYMEPLVRRNLVSIKNGEYHITTWPSNVDFFFDDNIVEAEFFSGYAKTLGFKWLRAPVTGPFTLSSKIHLREGGGLEATGVSDVMFVKLMAKYINSVLKYMEKLGYNYLFIDEPILGVLVGSKRLLFNWSEKDVEEVLETVFTNIGGLHGIHVCGRISRKLFDMLAESPSLQILNFEFHDSPENINVIDPGKLSSANKLLAPGVASSKNPLVEDLNEVRRLLQTLIEKTKGRVDLVSADCGFGGLATKSGSRLEAYEIALKKLYVIKKAVSEIENPP